MKNAYNKVEEDSNFLIIVKTKSAKFIILNFYVYSQMIAGNNHPKFGATKISWLIETVL